MKDFKLTPLQELYKGAADLFHSLEVGPWARSNAVKGVYLTLKRHRPMQIVRLLMGKTSW